MTEKTEVTEAAPKQPATVDLDAFKREILGQTQALITAERENAAKLIAEQKALADAEIARLTAELNGKVSLPKPEQVKPLTLDDLAAQIAELKGGKAAPAQTIDLDAVRKEAQEGAMREMRLEMFRMERQRAISEAKLPPVLAKMVQGKNIEEVSASIAELQAALGDVAKTAAEARAAEMKALLPSVATPLSTAAPLRALARDKGSLGHVLKAESDALAEAKAKLFAKKSW